MPYSHGAQDGDRLKNRTIASKEADEMVRRRTGRRERGTSPAGQSKHLWFGARNERGAAGVLSLESPRDHDTTRRATDRREGVLEGVADFNKK